MEKLLINTPQNVQIEYSLASLGTRILAFLIDYAMIVGYALLVYKLASSFLLAQDPWLQSGVIGLLLLPAFFYRLWTEIYFGGQTIGKKALNIKVVRLDGSRATVYEYFMRWILSIVDIWMLSGIVAVTSILFSKKSQRIGDLAAGTTVVSLKSRLSLAETGFEELAERYQVTYPAVVRLSDKDMNLIRSSFRKALQREDYVVIDALTQKLKVLLEINEIPGAQEDFLRTVIQDHYHLFKDE